MAFSKPSKLLKTRLVSSSRGICSFSREFLMKDSNHDRAGPVTRDRAAVCLLLSVSFTITLPLLVDSIDNTAPKTSCPAAYPSLSDLLFPSIRPSVYSFVPVPINISCLVTCLILLSPLLCDYVHACVS
ncbi:hypothetical protein GE09DRAFT_630769 [Coniochaeta sp. 2T2.1]|nr:hypothetical protein GE09DRAFT_630769 [Coniochaeta sp. 2T2.1]